MRTWKIDGPPEIVDGIVMYVMTSWSERPARRARNPPIVWMPSCELPARRMTTSLTERRLAETPESAPGVWVETGKTILGRDNAAGISGFVNEMEHDQRPGEGFGACALG